MAVDNNKNLITKNIWRTKMINEKIQTRNLAIQFLGEIFKDLDLSVFNKKEEQTSMTDEEFQEWIGDTNGLMGE